jgi:hypothetical protein
VPSPSTLPKIGTSLFTKLAIIFADLKSLVKKYKENKNLVASEFFLGKNDFGPLWNNSTS